jgi:cell division protease FtsH
VQKISIIPRGVAALGYTLHVPTEDRFLMTKSELENKIAVLLGGRGAEELVYNEVSTGAQDDLQKATDIAKNMIKTYGMSERLGQVSFEGERQPLFLSAGRAQGGGEYSEATAREIDNEVRRIIDEQYMRVKNLLGERLHELREAAAVLLVKETITGEELRGILINAPQKRSSVNNDQQKSLRQLNSHADVEHVS